MRFTYTGSILAEHDIRADKHACTYSDVLQDFESACARLLEILNQPVAQLAMELAEERFGLPALVGVVKEIEDDAGTSEASKHLRFRQFVGDCIRVLMERRGWHRTGEKDSIISWAKQYKRAERFARA